MQNLKKHIKTDILIKLKIKYIININGGID